MSGRVTRPDAQLFAFLCDGKRDEARGLLEQLLALAQEESSASRKVEPELCLPLPTALQGFECWLSRRRALDRAEPLSVFLEHVVSTVPYYQDRFYSSRIDGNVLERFPLVTKDDINGQYGRFISEPYASADKKFFKPTSGSTGEPLIVWYDLAAFYELCYATYGAVAEVATEVLDSVRVGGLGAVQVTDDPITWNASTVLTSLRFARLRRQLIGKNYELDRKTIGSLRREVIPLLCGLPTCLLRLAEIDRSVGGGLRMRPRAIFVSGENLFQSSRYAIEEWFGCRVYNAYASSEGGVIAMECGYRTGLHVKTDRVRLEVLNQHGRVQNEGAGELVLTNFVNWAMPFVRYRTGDYGTINETACECGHVGPTISNLPGRDAVCFETSSRRIDPQDIEARFMKLPVGEFQMIEQAPEQFLLRWAPCPTAMNPDDVESSMTKVLREIFGEIQVVFSRVDRTTAPGTKIRRYVRAES